MSSYSDGIMLIGCATQWFLLLPTSRALFGLLCGTASVIPRSFMRKSVTVEETIGFTFYSLSFITYLLQFPTLCQAVWVTQRCWNNQAANTKLNSFTYRTPHTHPSALSIKPNAPTCKEPIMNANEGLTQTVFLGKR